MWPHTVTVWCRDDNEHYSPCIVKGCLWEDRRGEQLCKTGATAANGVKIYLPITAQVRAGDYVAMGAIGEPVNTARDIVALGGLRVSAADRLEFGGLPHVEAVAG